MADDGSSNFDMDQEVSITQSEDCSPNFDVDQDMDIDVGHVDRGLNPSTVGHSIDSGQITCLVIFGGQACLQTDGQILVSGPSISTRIPLAELLALVRQSVHGFAPVGASGGIATPADGAAEQASADSPDADSEIDLRHPRLRHRDRLCGRQNWRAAFSRGTRFCWGSCSLFQTVW